MIKKEKPATLSLIYTTVGNLAQAGRLADQLIDLKFAACVQILNPIRSVYVWKGQKTQSRETGLLIKTSKARLKECLDWVESNHPYETPLILRADSVAVSSGYSVWLEIELKLANRTSGQAQRRKRRTK